MAFFLEYDAGTEPLQTLVDKLDGYAVLHRAGLHWPVLFWLHGSPRAQHLHRRLPTRQAVTVATAARDHVARLGASPAGAVWLVHGHDAVDRMRLADLPCT